MNKKKILSTLNFYPIARPISGSSLYQFDHKIYRRFSHPGRNRVNMMTDFDGSFKGDLKDSKVLRFYAYKATIKIYDFLFLFA